MSPLLPVPSLRRAYCALAAAAERPAADDQSWARLQHVALMCHEESVALPVVPAALQTWRVRFSRRWRCSCEPWQLRRQRTAGSAACRERSAPPPPPRWSSVPWRVAAHPPKKWTSESLVSRGALVARVRARAPRHARAQHKQATSRVRRLTHAMMAVAASRNEPGTFSTPQCSGAQSSDAPQLAVVGILSHDGRAAFRRAIRETWLRRVAHPPSIDARFVLRGIGAASSTIAEARVQRDIIFVPAQANATWAPPLQSVLLWYRCALAAWPAAQFIGKVRTRHHATCEP